MSQQIKVRRLVILDSEIVFTRPVSKRGRNHYAPQLQDIYQIEGRRELRQLAMRHFHGFVEVR